MDLVSGGVLVLELVLPDHRDHLAEIDRRIAVGDGRSVQRLGGGFATDRVVEFLEDPVHVPDTTSFAIPPEPSGTDKSLWVVITLRQDPRREARPTRTVILLEAIRVLVPSRRSLLGACGLLGASVLAGCADLADLSDYTRGPPPFTEWLYDPTARFDAEHVGYATLDGDRLRATEGTVPPTVTELLARAERQFASVDQSDLSRLTAVGFGSIEAGRAGGTFVAEGSFDPDALRSDYRMRRDEEWTDLGDRAGFERWAYEAPFLASL